MPITIIPEITISVRDNCRASVMMAPRPVCTPVISPTMITTQAKPSPSRRPVKIAGMLAGSTTLKNCAVPSQPSMLAASNDRGSTERAPKIVLIRIG